MSNTPQHWAFGMHHRARPNLVSVRVDFAGLETFVKPLLLEDSKPEVQVISCAHMWVQQRFRRASVASRAHTS